MKLNRIERLMGAVAPSAGHSRAGPDVRFVESRSRRLGNSDGEQRSGEIFRGSDQARWAIRFGAIVCRGLVAMESFSGLYMG